MSNSQEKHKFTSSRYIKAYLDDTDVKNIKVKTVFSKKPFSPEQFTQIFMGILEAYTVTLLENNPKEDVYDHFNNVFGIFLSKLLSEKEIYERDSEHKTFKDNVDKTLGQEETEELRKAAEDNRLAAYILCRDILINDVGLTEESADLILNRKIGLLKTPEVKKSEKE